MHATEIALLPCCSNSICKRRKCMVTFLRAQKCCFCGIPYDGFEPCFNRETPQIKSTRKFYRSNNVTDLTYAPLPSLKCYFQAKHIYARMYTIVSYSHACPAFLQVYSQAGAEEIINKSDPTFPVYFSNYKIKLIPSNL